MGVSVGIHQTGVETLRHKPPGPAGGKLPAEIDYWSQATITLGILTDDLARAMEELGAKGVEFVYPGALRFLLRALGGDQESPWQRA